MTSPLEAIGLLATQEVEVTPTFRHLEGFTLQGLLTILWHGSGEEERVVAACGGAMGGLLGPADGLYHDVGVALAAEGIGMLRVGYRRPNDMDACVYDLAAAIQLAAGHGAQRVVTMGHSFGGAVAVRTAVAMPDIVAGVVTFATQSAGCEVADQLHGRPLLLFHGDADEILPPWSSEMVRSIAGSGELIVLPGVGHLMTQAAEELRSRVLSWVPDVLASP